MKKGNTAALVWDLVSSFTKDLGLTLWDIRFLKEGANYYLRIFIDKDGGVSVDDCETVSRAIDKPLDDLDPIEQSYFLEVSSPGLERELTRPEHYEKMKGKTITVRLYKAVGNKREFIGTLEDFSDNIITLNVDGSLKEINKKDAAIVHAYYDFGGMTENE